MTIIYLQSLTFRSEAEQRFITSTASGPVRGKFSQFSLLPYDYQNFRHRKFRRQKFRRQKFCCRKFRRQKFHRR